MAVPKNKPFPGYPENDLIEMQSGGRYMRWILSCLTPWVKGNVCEVGAGVGNASKILTHSHPSRLVLLEPDAALFSKLQHELPSPVIEKVNGSLQSYAAIHPDTRFDTILYINVLEHIKDDKSELHLASQCMHPGGTLIIFAPALPWLFSENDRQVGHWRRYTKQSLRMVIQSAGFQIQKIHYFDFLGAFAWFFACRLMGLLPNASNVGFYDRLLVPVSRTFESIAPPILGKNLVAIATKQ